VTKTTYTGEQMRDLLVAGSLCQGRHVQAAVHLLLFTDLHTRPWFAEIVEIGPGGAGGALLECAFVNWTDLPNRIDPRLGSGTVNLINLAVAFADRQQIDIAAAVTSHGHAHARRIAEAVLILAGYQDWYTLQPGPDLVEHQRFTEELLG
jgi:hypothetical protein